MKEVNNKSNNLTVSYLNSYMALKKNLKSQSFYAMLSNIAMIAIIVCSGPLYGRSHRSVD